MEEARETLIQRFERMIDLPAYLGQRGFTPAISQPGARGLAMIDPRDLRTLLLEQDPDQGGWTYTPVDRPHDRGTVTDYLQRHDHLDRAACLERLIALAGGRRTRNADVLRYRGYVLSKPEVLLRAQQSYVHACQRYGEATRLLERVGIRRAGFDEWRFGGMVTKDEVMRALAEPEDLWISRYRLGDSRLVLTERPIDAISLEQGSRDRRTCYLAVGRAPNQALQTRIAHLLARLPHHMSVVLGFGRDRDGRRLAADIQALTPGICMERLAPAYGTRWNDQVCLESRHALSLSAAKRRLSSSAVAPLTATTLLVPAFASAPW